MNIIEFAEQVKGHKLLSFQKELLLKYQEAKENGQELICYFPYRHGKTMIKNIINEFEKQNNIDKSINH